MGQTTSHGLTQYDVAELQEYSKNRFTQQEIMLLYKRFRQLDRGGKGYISSSELLNIPELSVNPLASSMIHAFECVNFKEFVLLLSAFSPRASRREKLEFMFQIYDVDGDGIISASDMQLMLRSMAGSSLSDSQINTLVAKVEKESGVWKGGLDLEGYIQVLEGREIELNAEVPDDDK